jgi:Tyrosinase co-factor MelC1
MKVETETYRGKQIRIETDEEGDESHHGHDKVRLYIDDQHVHVMTLPDGRFGTHYLPYAVFPSILRLAVSLIDKVPLFNLKRN